MVTKAAAVATVVTTAVVTALAVLLRRHRTFPTPGSLAGTTRPAGTSSSTSRPVSGRGSIRHTAVEEVVVVTEVGMRNSSLMAAVVDMAVAPGDTVVEDMEDKEDMGDKEDTEEAEDMEDKEDMEEVRDTAEAAILPRKKSTRITVCCMELEGPRWGWRVVPQ